MSNQYSEFQLKLIALFEAEVLARLKAKKITLANENDVMNIVDEIYEEFFAIQNDLETGVIDGTQAMKDVSH